MKDFQTVKNNPVSNEEDFYFYCNIIKRGLEHFEAQWQLLIFKLAMPADDAFAFDEVFKESFKRNSDMILGSIERLEKIYEIIGKNNSVSIDDEITDWINLLKRGLEHLDVQRKSIIFDIPEKKISDIDEEFKESFKRILDTMLGSIERLEKIFKEQEKYGDLLKRYNGTAQVVDDGSGRELRFTKCGTASILETDY